MNNETSLLCAVCVVVGWLFGTISMIGYEQTVTEMEDELHECRVEWVEECTYLAVPASFVKEWDRHAAI